MKRILITGSLCVLAALCNAQMKQGKITYERVSQLRFNIADNGGGEQSHEQTRSD